MAKKTLACRAGGRRRGRADQPHPGAQEDRGRRAGGALRPRSREGRARRAEVPGARVGTRGSTSCSPTTSIDAIDICTPNFLHAPMATARARSRQARAVRAPAGAQRRRGSGRWCKRRAQGRPRADVRGAAPLPRRRRSCCAPSSTRAISAKSSTPRPAGCGSAPNGTPTSGAAQKRESGGGVVLDLGLPDARPVAVGAGQSQGGVGDRQRPPPAQGRGRGQRHRVPQARRRAPR